MYRNISTIKLSFSVKLTSLIVDDKERYPRRPSGLVVPSHTRVEIVSLILVKAGCIFWLPG